MPASTAPAEKNLLDQLSGPRNEHSFEVGWWETRATSFFGGLQLPPTPLQVLPKMYRRVLDGSLTFSSPSCESQVSSGASVKRRSFEIGFAAEEK